MSQQSTQPTAQLRAGLGRLIVVADRLDRVEALADHIDYVEHEGQRALLLEHHNAYVNTGLNNALDREFGLGGTAVGFIGVSSSTSAVTAATTFLNGAAAGAAANTIIKATDTPAPTRAGQTVTAGSTFGNAHFTSGVFVWNKIGLLTTSTDAGTGLVDVIGGQGGAAPYNRTFSLDLTSAGQFSVVAQIAVTAAAA